MGNFCTKCGKPLADGEICNCQGMPQQAAPQQAAPQQAAPQQAAPQQGMPQYQQAAPQQGMPQYQQAAPQQGMPQYQQMAPQPAESAVADYFKEFFNTALNIWKKPVSAGKQFVVSGKYGIAIGYLVAQAIFAVILGMIFEARTSLADVAEIFGTSVGVTYVKVFFGTLFLSALFSIMLAGLLLGFNIIAKNGMTFKNALCLTSIRSVIIVPATILTIVITLISPIAGGIFSLIINIWGFIAIIKALPVASENSDNLLVHCISLAILIFIIVALILMFTLGRECYCSGIAKQLRDLFKYIR